MQKNLFFDGLDPLTETEKRMVPYVLHLFETRKHWISNKSISMALSHFDFKNVSPARIRKILNHIRNARLGSGVIIAGGHGYKMSTNAEEISRYIDSLDKRIGAIVYLRENIYFDLKNKLN